ncbi:MAG TPA: AarF/UbiB family protein, partial [Elusimicrobiota bacterium]|nr:AarF/UbiB family protein [Elusimicrobiota bacterium]
IRAPGAAYRVSREFEMIDQLIKEMELRGDLDLPAARQLLDEVKAMVRAEMDFRDEAAKERAMLERVESRPWYARLLTARPYIPRPHPVLVSEDFMVEEFVTTRRFADLPSWSPFGPSKRSIARAAVDEGMFGLVFDEWLEPDPHTGNRHARWGGLYRFFSRLVVMDLGQGAPHPIERLKPLMRAALALQAGDVPAAAQRLYAIANRDVKQEEAKVLESLAKGIALRPEAGLIERLMDGLLEAEKLGVLVKPEYAALEKAMILYTGYSDYLPKDYILHSLERATVARLMRDGKLSAWGAVKLWFTRLFLGSAATRAELERLIEAL